MGVRNYALSPTTSVYFQNCSGKIITKRQNRRATIRNKQKKHANICLQNFVD